MNGKRGFSYAWSTRLLVLEYAKPRVVNPKFLLAPTRIKVLALKRLIAALNNIEVIEPGHDVAIFRFLAVQFDLEAQVVERVGIAERIFVGDEPRFV